MAKRELTWRKALEPGELADGRVKEVCFGRYTLAMVRFDGKITALDGTCPHRGGPLSEGVIEHGMVHCPWHGWEFHPHTGAPPEEGGESVKTYPVEVREDGVYVGIERE